MKVIVPGASGFIGKNLLLKAPKSWDITAIHNNSPDFASFIEEHGLTNVTVVKCDLIDAHQIDAILNEFDKFDTCVFLAANGDPVFSVKEPALDLKMTTLTFLNFMKSVDVGRMVYLSSGAVYEGLIGEISPKSILNPTLPYALSHLATENYVRAFTRSDKIDEYVVLRFFGAYGPYEPERKIYSRLLKAFYLEDKEVFEIRGDGTNYIDAMYADDAVEGIISAVLGKEKNVTVDFCSEDRKTIDELVEMCAQILGKDDVKIIKKGQTAEAIKFWASGSQMEQAFGFKPTIGLEDGYKRFLELYMSEEKR